MPFLLAGVLLFLVVVVALTFVIPVQVGGQRRYVFRAMAQNLFAFEMVEECDNSIDIFEFQGLTGQTTTSTPLADTLNCSPIS